MLMRDACLKQWIPCIIRISIFGAVLAEKKCVLYTGAPSWSPMRLKIEYWRPEFYSWSLVGNLLLSSEPFANKCLAFYPADVFEIKMKGVFPLTTSIGLHNVTSLHVFFFEGGGGSHKVRIAGEKTVTQ